jgi:hypothetical protein
MAVVMVGCVASLPPGDPSIPADLANETARMVVLMRREIRPAPQSDACDNCNGTGRIGDSVNVVRQCPVCRGTGKRTATLATSGTICTTGTCRVLR